MAHVGEMDSEVTLRVWVDANNPLEQRRSGISELLDKFFVKFGAKPRRIRQSNISISIWGKTSQRNNEYGFERFVLT